MNYNMFNKYSKLMDKLYGYSIYRYQDDSIINEYFLVARNDGTEEKYFVSVYVTDKEEFNIIIETKEDNEYYVVEDKKYKTVNGAYKKIIQALNPTI